MDRGTRGASGHVEWVDLGELTAISPEAEVLEPDPRPARSRRTTLVAALAGVAVVGALLIHNEDSTPAKDSGPKPTAVTPTAAPITGTGQLLAGTPQLTAVQVTDVGAHVLGVRAGWGLVGWGADHVVRLELAAGRLTVTAVPPVQSTGPVSLAVASDRIVVRPLDDVPGYAVVDGRRATALAGVLAGGGPMLPGPTPGLVWREEDDWFSSVVLTRLDGVETGVRVPLPADDGGQLVPDGSGYVLSIGAKAVYDVRPEATRRVTTGVLAAVGAGRLLAVECAGLGSCSAVAAHTDGTSRKVIDATFQQPQGIGPISPDGRRAAVVVQAPDGESNLELVDLHSGKVVVVAMAPGPSAATDLAWSPDSRMLFALDADGRVHVVDPLTGALRRMPVALPALTQIAVRPAPR